MGASIKTGGGGGRRGRRRSKPAPMSEINVTPFVDVMLVLLIIFMVAAPMMTQGMAVNLPTAAKARPVSAQPIYVTIPAAFGQNRIVQIDKDEIRFEILAERIRQVMLGQSDKSVFVRSDGGVPR